MGYYVTITGADFRIPKDLLDPAFEALTELNKRDDLKTGGSYGPNGKTAVWFAWMDEDYPARALEAVTEGKFSHPTEAVFGMLGFETKITEDGDLRLSYYDSKTGNEDAFLRAVALFVAPGSYLNWEGEDGAHFRYEFDGLGEMTEKSGRVVFD